jgi:hypothetical protein
MAQIRLLPRKSVLQFLITKNPVAEVGGARHELRWGKETPIEATEGEHTLTVWFPYLGRDAGKASTTVRAGDPGPLVRYKTPFWVTAGGRLTVE